MQNLKFSKSLKFLFLFALCLSLSSLSELNAGRRSNYYSDSALDELRLELAEVKHELKSAQVEINLFDERLKKQDETLKAVSAPKSTGELSQLSLKIASLDKKIAQIDTFIEKVSGDLRTLNTTSTQTLSKIQTIEQDIASHEKRLDEVVKLKGTLTSISKAMGQNTPSNGKTYRVKAGDSLEKIARNQQITVAALKKLNQLKDDRIIVGQELKISDE